jgi:5-deoxy-glucuronate isomerase
MPYHVRASAQAHDNQPVIGSGDPRADLCYFQLLQLREGESATVRVPGYETLFVVLAGCADVTVDGQPFAAVGKRPDVWSGRADAVYAGTGAEVVVTGRAGRTEIAVAGGRTAGTFAPFRISPDDVEMVDVGSSDTHCHRRIFHVLGHNAAGRAGNLLVSELYCDPGNWSGVPSHKHDQERVPEETEFQEIYHYRFRPETGFGAQFCYREGAEPTVAMTGHGDTFIVDRGYHPTVTSPGHEEYVFTILVGRHQRSLIQYFEPKHRHLLDVIPGIQAMRDKFK